MKIKKTVQTIELKLNMATLMSMVKLKSDIFRVAKLSKMVNCAILCHFVLVYIYIKSVLTQVIFQTKIAENIMVRFD